MIPYVVGKVQNDPNYINMVPAGDSLQPMGIAVGKDTVHNPFAGLRSYSGGRSYSLTVGGMYWTTNMIHSLELWLASFTPKGSFLTWIVGKNSISNGWKFVKEKGTKDPIEGKNHDLLVALTKKFKMKKNVTLAIQVAKIFGRSLVFLWQKGGQGKAKKIILRIAHLEEQHIYYDEETGEVLEYTPYIKIGRNWRNVTIKPEDAVLYVNDPDPFGNENDGISSLLSSYRTLIREENISEGYTQIIVQRGLGLLDVTVKGAKSEADLEPWHKKYGDPGSYSAMFHNERLEVKTTDGMRAGYNYDQTLGRMTKSVSSASGYPGMRMEGVQTGAVTGSETDQDNTAEQYRGIHENYEDSIIETYHLLDSDTTKFYFELEFPFDIKMDRAKISQIFSTNVQSIVTLPELITVNQALELMELRPFDGKEGDQYVIEFMKKERIESEEKYPTAPEAEKNINEGEVEPNKSLTKKSVAKQMIKENISKDSADQIGVRKLNETLRTVFGTGMSYDYWTTYRKEVMEEMI